MSELRRDPIVNRWVILAPDRALRPNSSQPRLDFNPHADDPFAEGCESETPGELWAIRQPGTRPDAPGWQVRVVPNKYPAVRRDLSPAPMDLRAAATPASGLHEVIIECPQFETCLSHLPVEQVRSVVQVYRDRLQYHRQQQESAHAMVFKNKGVAAGATLAHAHSQLIASPWIPPLLAEELAACAAHHHTTGGDLFGEYLERELAAEERVILATETLVALCPFAARVPGEIWLLPRTPMEQFEQVSDALLAETAAVLRDLLQRLNAILPGLAYNYALHSAPISPAAAPGFRWHFEILPRVGNVGGYEWGGGSYINTLRPEDAAGQLRQVRQPD